MRIIINGQEYNFQDDLTLSELVSNLELDTDKIAIERNIEVVPFENYSKTKLEDGDNLEIIHFIGGG